MREKLETKSSTFCEIMCILRRLQNDDKLLKKVLAFLIGLDSSHK